MKTKTYIFILFISLVINVITIKAFKTEYESTAKQCGPQQLAFEKCDLESNFEVKALCKQQAGENLLACDSFTNYIIIALISATATLTSILSIYLIIKNVFLKIVNTKGGSR